MPKNIDSYILTDKVIEKMKGQIDKTRNSEIEHGFSLCSKSDKTIIDRRHCEGGACHSIMDVGCEKNEELVGFYHTHPGPDSGMSAGDMKAICERGKEKNGEIIPMRFIACVGSSGNKINCYIRKTFPPELDKKMAISCVEEAIKIHNKIFIPLDKRAQELFIESNKIKEEFSAQNRSKGRFSEVLEKKVSSHMAGLKKYEKENKKYEEKLKNLTNKHFDTINIL